MTVRLDSGSAAPDFALLDQDGATVRLDDLRGQKTVLYFYPAAMTPVSYTHLTLPTTPYV